VRQLNERINKLQEKNQQFTAELILQTHRLTKVLEGPAGKDAAGNVGTGVREAQQPHLLDAFYASFDEQFRGHKDHIKERLKVYLPFLANLPVTANILDVGCGRGEWLELLKENGHHAIGVDTNSILVEQCQERELEIVQSDLLSYLNRLSDNSLDAISGFHIVEHLPLQTLVAFLNETLRVLKPGGVIILETPNPRNVLVGSCNFYFDPTHQNPIPSEVLKFLIDSRGFAKTKVLPLNPSDEKPVAGDSELVQRFNMLFYGPMDYGLVGWKPQPGNYDAQVEE
jgi:O-antigen chain-terminating methyltransferase